MENQEEKAITKYSAEFDSFMASYKNDDSVTGERVGHMVAVMSQFFSEYNLKYAYAEVAFNRVAKTYEQSSDEATGKPLSSAKAKVLAIATPEGEAMIIAKADVENVEQNINSLKSLQKGVLNDFAYSGVS